MGRPVNSWQNDLAQFSGTLKNFAPVAVDNVGRHEDQQARLACRAAFATEEESEEWNLRDIGQDGFRF